MANSWAFTVDFIMTNGISFDEDPTTLTTISELVQNIDLVAEPGSSTNGFQATLTAESTPVEATDYTELGTKE